MVFRQFYKKQIERSVSLILGILDNLVQFRHSLIVLLAECGLTFDSILHAGVITLDPTAR